MDYATKLKEQYIELFFSTWGFKPSDPQVEKYVNSECDIRLAIRERLKQTKRTNFY